MNPLDPDRIPTKDGYIYVGDGRGIDRFTEHRSGTVRFLFPVLLFVAFSVCWAAPIVVLTHWMPFGIAVAIEAAFIGVAWAAWRLGRSKGGRPG